MSKNIFLIGPSWTGKSTLWKPTAKYLWIDFQDWDDDFLEKISLDKAKYYLEKLNLKHIEPIKIVNETVSNIKEILWDEKFLELEKELTINYDFSNSTLYSTSWSLVLKNEAMSFLKKIWTIIYLQPIEKNISDKRILEIQLDRIVWMPSNIMKLDDSEKIRLYKEIMQKRIDWYEKNADFTYVRPKETIIYEKTPNWVYKLTNYWRKIINKEESIKATLKDFHNFLKEKWIA